MSQFKQRIQFEEQHEGLRLDQALAQLLPQFSRAQIQTWIKQGDVLTNSKKLRARDKVQIGQYVDIDITFEQTNDWQADDIKLNIIYEDDDLIVIDKPAGLVVHPGAGIAIGTLVNGLLAKYPSLQELPRCGIVHRIDKDTTGLLVVAKSSLAHQSLSEQLQTRTMSRRYQAIVKGSLIAGSTIEAPIGRHPKNRTKMAVHPHGREAKTHYRVIERFQHYTHVSVKLDSGRTHQIRVHFDHMHYPLVGDPVYGTNIKPLAAKSDELRHTLQQFKRQALHACELSLEHPRTHETMTWKSPLPEDMQQLLAALHTEQAHIEG